MSDPSCFDEMRGPTGKVRDAYREFADWLETMPVESLQTKVKEADTLFRRLGITFLVYGEGGSTERLIPFDIIPRILAADEWRTVESGSIQRVRALNMFLHDVYHGREICKAGIVPAELILDNDAYRPEVHGIELPYHVYAHIAGIDVVRTGENEFHVLEDNLRTPSGVSYMLEDRDVMMRLFPEAFATHKIAPVENYPDRLLNNLRAVSPLGTENPTVVLLTPGRYNSAYFEHVFLAEQMGIELVEGSDLFVRDGQVFMRTTEGPERVHVIYRRLDDEFMDPLAFRPDSALGVPGILSVVREGGVTLANALGSGVADDKAVYTYVPDIIRFYLGEEPILANVPTWRLREKENLKYVLDHLDELVVKEVHGSGGYGMLVGPTASKEECAAYKERILANPADFIAQPTLALSTCPTFVDEGVAPRHVDLRPFVLSGETVSLVPGAFTRVALREGSLVVNSSQGGGTKDTWVLEGRGVMLSRSAENLYWMGRYMERAENAARVLEVSNRMSVLPTEQGSESLHWRPAVEIGPDPDDFWTRYDEATAANVIAYMALDRENPSSIYACIRAARENARAERVAISSEMWESLNTTWLEIGDLDPGGLKRWGHRQFFDWIKERSHLFRGVTVGTLLQDDGFHFLRLGSALERADNTARILDVKYHILLPSAEEVGGAVDYYQWGALLRSVSAFTAYRKVYRDAITPARVAEMLILRGDMPRSLHYCLDQVTQTLDHLAPVTELECRRLAGEIHADLRFGKTATIIQRGLHEFLEDFIRRNNQLGREIQRDFLMAEVIEYGE